MHELEIDPNWEKVTCPGCGAVVYLDNVKRASHHQHPVCKWFLQACQDTKGKHVGETRIVPPGERSS